MIIQRTHRFILYQRPMAGSVHRLATVQVIFNPPVLVNNQLTINQGQALILTVENLQATQTSRDDEQLWFIFSQVTHGNFSLINASTTPINRFQQHPSPRAKCNLCRMELLNRPATGSQSLMVKSPPMLNPPLLISIRCRYWLTIRLIIGQNQTIPLTSEQLSAIHRGIADPDLQFEIIQCHPCGVQSNAFTPVVIAN